MNGDVMIHPLELSAVPMMFWGLFFYFFSELPHSPRSLTARLNDSDSRSVLLSWLRPFDGNSPLLYYVLELSENSKFACVRVCVWVS